MICGCVWTNQTVSHSALTTFAGCSRALERIFWPRTDFLSGDRDEPPEDRKQPPDQAANPSNFGIGWISVIGTHARGADGKSRPAVVTGGGSGRLQSPICPKYAREVVMSEQHAALLKKARERLVENRRNFSKIIAAPFEREKTNDARTRFIEMQTAIEAVDRAIEDEEDDDATV